MVFPPQVPGGSVECQVILELQRFSAVMSHSDSAAQQLGSRVEVLAQLVGALSESQDMMSAGIKDVTRRQAHVEELFASRGAEFGFYSPGCTVRVDGSPVGDGGG